MTDPSQRERREALLAFCFGIVASFVAVHEALLAPPVVTLLEGVVILVAASAATVAFVDFGITARRVRRSRPETGSHDDMNEITQSTGGIADE
ncbi:hypothetical protein [Halobaculum sp. EA56]|uniref:hypothetical protein n=1 Tax=Halobaculum sp. EA56 TaxID=3421648 RepID=UPI003EB69BE3